MFTHCHCHTCIASMPVAAVVGMEMSDNALYGISMIMVAATYVVYCFHKYPLGTYYVVECFRNCYIHTSTLSLW